MKKHKHTIITTILATLAYIAFAPIYGQEASSILDPVITAAPTNLFTPETDGLLLAFFADIAKEHAWLGSVIILMGLLRAVAKPLSSAVHFIVDLTPSPRDNGWLNGLMLFFTQNQFGKMLAYVVDWLTSIKIKPPTA